jgi:hypothetical protein
MLLLSGCSATPAGFQKLPDLKFGEAGLYVYRTDRSERRAPTFGIFVDETKVGSLPHDGYLSLIVPSGAHSVQAGLGDGGIFSKETMIKTTLVVDDQRHYFLQIVLLPPSGSPSTAAAPNAYFTLTPESTAIEELRTRPVK